VCKFLLTIKITFLPQGFHIPHPIILTAAVSFRPTVWQMFNAQLSRPFKLHANVNKYAHWGIPVSLDLGRQGDLKIPVNF